MRENSKQKLQRELYTPLQFAKAICHSVESVAHNFLGRIIEADEEEQVPSVLHPVQVLIPVHRCIICFGGREKVISFIPFGQNICD